MRRTHLIAVLAGLAAIGLITADAAAVYHPTMGRFLQRDPGPGGVSPARIGSAGPAVGSGFIPRDPTGSRQYADGMNLYQYVGSDPVRHVDWNGREAQDASKQHLAKLTPIVDAYFESLAADGIMDYFDAIAQVNKHRAKAGQAGLSHLGKCGCGTDATDWLTDQMNTNKDHPVIKTSREVLWPNYIPFFNLGWNAGFLNDFKNLVKAGAPWDFKVTQKFTAGDCPTATCKGTVTICGICLNKDVPGNIHYGWVGKQAGLREWVIYAGGNWAAPGFSDGDDDKAAISIGIEMANKGTEMCTLIRQKEAQLNKGGTKGCNPCITKHK